MPYFKLTKTDRRLHAHLCNQLERARTSAQIRKELEDARTCTQNMLAITTGALYYACANDWHKCVRVVLEDFKIDADGTIDDQMVTPLMVACSTTVVNMLVANNASVFAEDSDYKTALMHAKTPPVAQAILDCVRKIDEEEDGASLKAYMNKTDIDGYTALMWAILEDRHEISHLLLEVGASADSADDLGRTVLMNAAWKRQAGVVAQLIGKGAKVDEFDFRGRSVLHHLFEDPWVHDGSGNENNDHHADVTMLEMVLEANDRVKGQLDPNWKDNYTGKTVVHLAAAQNKSKVIDILLRYAYCRPDVNLLDLRKETALHAAAANGCIEAALLLIRSHADMQKKNHLGHTVLHLASAAPGDPVEIVQELLGKESSGLDINAKDYWNRTALHLAAETDNINIVKLLLSQTGVDVSARDDSGHTALVSAAMLGHKKIVRSLSARNYASVSETTIAASQHFVATIIDMQPGTRGADPCARLSRPLSHLLSGQSPLLAEGTGRSGRFRWIHLPANNTAWCRELLIQALERDIADPETFEALQESFNWECTGTDPHAYYMTPVCRTIQQVGPQTDPEASRRSTHSLETDIDAHGESEVQVNGTVNEFSKPRKRKKRQERPSNVVSINSKMTLTARADIDPCSTPAEEHNISHSMFLFMPYLSYEKWSSVQAMQKVVTSARKAASSSIEDTVKRTTLRRHATELETHFLSKLPASNFDRKRDEDLIRAHIDEMKCSMHVRRTLNQFFHTKIDSSILDGRQVALDYQRRCKSPKENRTDSESSRNTEILMVDQLWIWIVSDRLIVTSFPQRWEKADNDTENLLEHMLKELMSPTHESISDVYELAMFVARQCTEASDSLSARNIKNSTLGMFESAIGNLMDQERLLFEQFEEASVEASRSLRLHRGVSHSAIRSRVMQGEYETDIHSRCRDPAELQMPKQVFTQTLLDISKEIQLLRQVKGVRDELSILKSVFTQQETTCKGAYSDITSVLQKSDHDPKDKARRTKLEKMGESHKSSLSALLNDVRRMEEQAERVDQALKDQLDLKQTYANALQAADMARQSQTLIVFTVVTVIFLPLSFLAAFFAINIEAFPHDKNGDSNMTLGYVSKYVFGIGFAIALPCVVVALTVKKIVLFGRVCGERMHSVLAGDTLKQTIVSWRPQQIFHLCQPQQAASLGSAQQLPLPVSAPNRE